MSSLITKHVRRTSLRSAVAMVFFAGLVQLPANSAGTLIRPHVPELEEGAGIITNKQLALVLGKALFWDKQAGSDGMACASCHFSAGADSRIRNQLTPGFKDARFGPDGDQTFGSTHSDTGAVLPGEMPSLNKARSNYVLNKADFPLHQPSDYKDRNSPLRTTTNDVVSSSGAYNTKFISVNASGGRDKCTKADGSVFRAGPYPGRQVEPRNTPTTINAAFYHSNFWDGRANNLFNGVGVFGMRDIQGDPNKRLIILNASNEPELGYLTIRNASLASQAVGPPLSALEMSCDGRTFADVGRKLLPLVALKTQKVAVSDSVLGPYAKPDPGKGLKVAHTYASLIKQAFEPRYWAAPGTYKIVNGVLTEDPAGYSQMEINFTMFWGLAIMLYEQTLVSDQNRFFAWFDSCRPAATNASPGTVPIGNPVVTCQPAVGNPNQSTDPTTHGFTAQEVLGFGLFNNGGAGFGIRSAGNPACAACHGPIANPRAPGPLIYPVLSEAAFTSAQTTPYNPVERSLITDLGDGIPPIPNTFPAIPITDQRAGAVHDRGFFNIGVSPTAVDPGNGSLDPYGNPLSLARMFLAEQTATPGLPNPVVDPPWIVTPAAALTPTGITTINRCTSPGTIEPGGTPQFPGCGGIPGPFDASLERHVVDGGFKTPSLLNVGLTPPYFHSGNYSDLRSVVEFYARGGSRRSKSLEDPALTGDNSGTGPLGKDGPLGPLAPETNHGTNVDFFIRDIKSTDEQIDAVVAFMLTMTDRRVQCDQAPFDHPELTLFHGHKPYDYEPIDGKADDIEVLLPAVGSAGYTASSGRCIPNAGDLFAPGMQGRVGGVKVPL
jgi:cytochrome c peroxidase